MRIVALCLPALALAALFPTPARADDLKFDEVILIEGKGRDFSLLYVVLTEPRADLDKRADRVAKYAGAAIKEAAARKFKGAGKEDDKPMYEGNIVFFVRSAKGDRRGALTGFSVDQLKEIMAAKPERASEIVARHAWTRGELPGK
jgi:hypothetical protein